jgi:hypothetical protein
MNRTLKRLLIRGGGRLAGGGWVEGGSGLSFTTISTNAAWTPTAVTKTGGTLTWQVLSSTGVLLLESVANKPTFDLSALAGTKTLRVTSPDGWAGLTALNFTGATADIASLNLAVATGLLSLTLNSLTNLSWTVNSTSPMPASLATIAFTSVSGVIWVVSDAAPMPVGLTSLVFNGPVGVTWTIGTSAPMPTSLALLFLSTLSTINWTVGVNAPMPSTMQTLTVRACANIAAISTWAINSYRAIVYENNLAQAAVDAVLAAIWANKANYIYATPSLDIAGTGNAAPSGTYQAASPPTTGKEYAYDLVNGAYTAAGPEWVVTYTP